MKKYLYVYLLWHFIDFLSLQNCSYYNKIIQTLTTEFNQTSETSETSNSMTEDFDKIYNNLLVNFL